MAKPKMGWDPRQKRWRVTYKKVLLNIKAVDLGGTNRDDTLVAANRWFEEQKALIDARILQKRLHPQEEAYKAEQEEMKTAIKFLSKLKGTDPEIESVIETLKEKVERIRQTPQNESTPLIDIHRRNPLHVSGQEIQAEADQAAFEELFAEGIEEYELFKHNRDWLESHALYTPAHVEGAMPEGIVCLSYDDYINNRFENDQ